MHQNKIKIGIVDDHQLILDGLKNLLQTIPDYEIVMVENNASIALEYVQSNPIDLIITDVAMPEMNGAEFIKKIKKSHPKVKILVLSMYKTDLIDENDINGYLLKESSSETILKKVNDIVTKETKLHHPTSDKTHSSLSKREKEIVIEIGHGLSSEQIAEKLFLSYYTVETHKKNIYLKLNVKTTGELIKKAIYIGIIT